MDTTVIRPDPQSEFPTAERCHILEISNSGADPGLSISRARVEPGVTTAWHRLNDTAERYVILDGTGRVEVGQNGPQDVQAGDVVLIPQDIDQRITNTGQKDLIFLCVCTPRFRESNYKDTEAENSRKKSS